MKLNMIRRIVLIVYAIGFSAVALFFVPRTTLYSGSTPTGERGYPVEHYDTVTDFGVLAARLTAWTVVCGVAFALGSRSPKPTEE